MFSFSRVIFNLLKGHDTQRNMYCCKIYGAKSVNFLFTPLIILNYYSYIIETDEDIRIMSMTKILFGFFYYR